MDGWIVGLKMWLVVNFFCVCLHSESKTSRAQELWPKVPEWKARNTDIYGSDRTARSTPLNRKLSQEILKRLLWRQA